MNDNLAAVGAQVIPVFAAATLIAATVVSSRLREQIEAAARVDRETYEAMLSARKEGMTGSALIEHANTVREEAWENHDPGYESTALKILGSSVGLIWHLAFQTLQFAAFAFCIVQLLGPTSDFSLIIVMVALLLGMASLSIWPLTAMGPAKRLVLRHELIQLKLAKLLSDADKEALVEEEAFPQETLNSPQNES